MILNISCVNSCSCRNALAGLISGLFVRMALVNKVHVQQVSIAGDNFITRFFAFVTSGGGLLAVFTDVCCCLTPWFRGSQSEAFVFIAGFIRGLLLCQSSLGGSIFLLSVIPLGNFGLFLAHGKCKAYFRV